MLQQLTYRNHADNDVNSTIEWARDDSFDAIQYKRQFASWSEYATAAPVMQESGQSSCTTLDAAQRST